MKINDEILGILQDCKVDGDIVYIPGEIGALPRKTYEAVNKCLVNIGGKWNRAKKGHVFDRDISDAFEVMLMTGETEDSKKTFQFFPTPPAVADLMCDMAELSPKNVLLEPSCGKGDLADAAYDRGVTRITGIELNEDMRRYLDDKPYEVLFRDFLSIPSPDMGTGHWEEPEFDRILMNPPFTKQQDIAHIRHAYDFLEPGGILVTVCSPSPFLRDDKKSVAFREWLDGLNSRIFDMSEGAFKESGTMIKTKIIKIVKRD